MIKVIYNVLTKLFSARYSGEDEGLPTCGAKLAYSFI